MQTKHGNLLQAFRGVQQFLDSHTDTLGAVATCGARKRLDAALDEFQMLVMTQMRATHASRRVTQKMYALRQTLLSDHMLPLARVAAARLHKSPDLRSFKMPRGTPSTTTLYEAAMAMAEAAQPYAAAFTAAGLRKGFIGQLRAVAEEMIGQLDERAQHSTAHQAATRGIETALCIARLAVRVLDALVHRELKSIALLAAWDTVKRPRKTAPTPAAAREPDRSAAA